MFWPQTKNYISAVTQLHLWIDDTWAACRSTSRPLRNGMECFTGYLEQFVFDDGLLGRLMLHSLALSLMKQLAAAKADVQFPA